MISGNISTLIASSMYGNSDTTSSLFGLSDSDSSSSLDFKAVLTAHYIDQPAAEVELSGGLAAFIENNVEDEGLQASLLADLESIDKIFGTDESNDSSAESLLFNNGQSSSIIDLLA